MKVERTQDQGTHLTHPCVLLGRVANRVAPLSHQLVELEVYRLGREYKGEVTLTAQLAQEASHAYVAAQAHGCLAVDQHVGGSQQLSRRDPTGSCVEPAVNNFGMAECQLHFLEEIIKRNFCLLRQLARETNS